MVQSPLDLCLCKILDITLCNVGYQALIYFYAHIMCIKLKYLTLYSLVFGVSSHV